MFTNSKHKAAHEALRKGEVDKAIVLYTEALNLAPNDCDILSDRATAFLHKKDKLRSLADFNKAVQLDPNYAYRYAARAFAKQSFGDLDGAVEDYRKAVDLDPEDAVAQNNLGMLLEQQGYKKEADERFERADKLSKMEDSLYAMMDELEGENQNAPPLHPDASANSTGKLNDSDFKQEKDKTKVLHETGTEGSSKSEELKKVFTSRKQFREFVQFVKNGFKLK